MRSKSKIKKCVFDEVHIFKNIYRRYDSINKVIPRE